jgi:hypothetical protein
MRTTSPGENLQLLAAERRMAYIGLPKGNGES